MLTVRALHFEPAEAKNRKPVLSFTSPHPFHPTVPVQNVSHSHRCLPLVFHFISYALDADSLFFSFCTHTFYTFGFHSIWVSHSHSLSSPSIFSRLAFITSFEGTKNVLSRRARIYRVWNRTQMNISEGMHERKKNGMKSNEGKTNKTDRNESTERECTHIFRFNTKYHWTFLTSEH